MCEVTDELERLLAALAAKRAAEEPAQEAAAWAWVLSNAQLQVAEARRDVAAAELRCDGQPGCGREYDYPAWVALCQGLRWLDNACTYAANSYDARHDTETAREYRAEASAACRKLRRIGWFYAGPARREYTPPGFATL